MQTSKTSPEAFPFVHVSTDDLHQLISPPVAAKENQHQSTNSHLDVNENFPTSSAEERIVNQYLKNSSNKPKPSPLYFSFGETWTEAPKKLIEYAAQDYPLYLNGYILNQYGLPQLLSVLRKTIPSEHLLPNSFKLGVDFQLAVASQGTRAHMFDFGRLLLDRAKEQGETRTPVVVVPLPGWDYPGVYSSLGFKIRYLPLRRDENFHPLKSDFLEILKEIEVNCESEYLALTVINAQHNPTGVNWSEEYVKFLIEETFSKKGALLIDDAYYKVTDANLKPTSTLKLLANFLKENPSNSTNHIHENSWLSVRSLGKQYFCNGWGLGVVMGSVSTMDKMINRYLDSRAYVYAGQHQWAMSQWVLDPESEKFINEMNDNFREKRKILAKELTENLGYPETAFFIGETTSYALFEIPQWFINRHQEQGHHNHQNAIEDAYRKEIFDQTGVLFHMGSYIHTKKSYTFNRPMLRIFLGPKPEALTHAFSRLKEAHFTWQRN
jgi:aspartate/methionine/tyrosine aminotransferase